MTTRDEDEREWEAIAEHLGVEITDEMRAQFAAETLEREQRHALDTVFNTTISPEFTEMLGDLQARLQRQVDALGYRETRVELTVRYTDGTPAYHLAVTTIEEHKEQIEPLLDVLTPQVQEWDALLAAIQHATRGGPS